MKKFEESVQELYGEGASSPAGQLKLFEEREQYEPNK